MPKAVVKKAGARRAVKKAPKKVVRAVAREVERKVERKVAAVVTHSKRAHVAAGRKVLAAASAGLRREKVGPGSAVYNFMEAIVLPQVAKPTARVANSYDTTATAVMKFYEVGQYPFWGTAAAPGASYRSYMPAEQGFFCIAPYLLQNKIFYNANPGGMSSTYNAVFTNSGSAPTSNIGLTAAADEPVPLPVAYYNWNNGALWHGGNLACNSDPEGNPGLRYVYMQIGDSLNLTIGALTADGWAAALHIWNRGVRSEVPFGGTLAAGNNTFTATFDGYVALSLVPTAVTTSAPQATIASFGITYNPNAGRFCFQAANNAWSLVGNMTDVRNVGQSLLMTNVAAEGFRAGTIVQRQQEIGSHWTNAFSSSSTVGAFLGFGPFETLSNSPRDTDLNRDAKKGSYMWRKPATPDWDRWVGEYTVLNQTLMDTHLPLIPQHAAYAVWSCNIPAAVGGASALQTAQSMRWRVDLHTEAKSTDITRAIAPADGNPMQFLEAQAALRMEPQYSENPLHWMQMLEGLRNGAKTIAGMIAGAAPTVGRIAQQVHDWLS